MYDNEWRHILEAVRELLKRWAKKVPPPRFGKVTIELDLVDGEVRSGRIVPLYAELVKRENQTE